MTDNLPAQPGTGTALVNYEEKWAREAQQQAAAEPTGGAPFISTKGGIFSFNDQQMPGNQIAAIVLDSWFENSLYANNIDPGQRYDPDDPMPPICYAFSRSGADLSPHESMQKSPEYFVPQHFPCQGCRWNEWGSALQGRGKACQNRRRLTLLPGGYYTPKRGNPNDFDLHIYDDPRYFAEADSAFLRLPVTSTTEWGKYVNMLSATMNRPYHMVMTRLYLVPDPKSQYKVKFDVIGAAPPPLWEVLDRRHELEMPNSPQGYDAPDPNAPRRGAGGYGSGNMRGFAQQQPQGHQGYQPTVYQQMAAVPPVQSRQAPEGYFYGPDGQLYPYNRGPGQ